MNAIALQTNGLVKMFGGLTAVNRVDLVVPEATIASVIGPNGAGKTTFFNCITGFYPPDDGTMLFFGKPLTGYTPDHITYLGISRTYQNIRLFANMTAIENILVGQHPRLETYWVESILHNPRQRKEEAFALEEAVRLLRFVGLVGLGDHLARNLPYGAQRQIGRASCRERV